MDWKSPRVARDDEIFCQDALAKLVRIYGIPLPMLCVEQLPDDPATVEMHARRATRVPRRPRKLRFTRVAAEIQAAVDEAVQAAVAKAIKETTALFCGAFTARGTNASIRGNSCCSA